MFHAFHKKSHAAILSSVHSVMGDGIDAVAEFERHDRENNGEHEVLSEVRHEARGLRGSFPHPVVVIFIEAPVMLDALEDQEQMPVSSVYGIMGTISEAEHEMMQVVREIEHEMSLAISTALKEMDSFEKLLFGGDCDSLSGFDERNMHPVQVLDSLEATKVEVPSLVGVDSAPDMSTL